MFNSTKRVLEGLGALMSEAAEAVASAGHREDLAGVGLSDDLMALAKRLDAARKEGECVSSLLQAPQQLLGGVASVDAGDGVMQRLAGCVEEDLRRWRRRALVSGTWHEMREQSAGIYVT